MTWRGYCWMALHTTMLLLVAAFFGLTVYSSGASASMVALAFLGIAIPSVVITVAMIVTARRGAETR